jgi:hypothetical protein
VKVLSPSWLAIFPTVVFRSPLVMSAACDTPTHNTAHKINLFIFHASTKIDIYIPSKALSCSNAEQGPLPHLSPTHLELIQNNYLASSRETREDARAKN